MDDIGLIMAQCISDIYYLVTVFNKGQREVQPFGKCLNFKSSPILVKEVGHQISIFSKFKKVFIILLVHRAFEHCYKTLGPKLVILEML